MAKRKATQGTPAIVALRDAGVPHTLYPYDHDSDTAAHRYGIEAAEALGVPQDRIFKTLLVDANGELAVAVVPVSANLDPKALAAALGRKKVQLADPTVAERVTGYVVGGISPLGQKRRLPTVVDDSALGWETVYVSAGRRGLQVELAPADLVRLTAATTAAIRA